MINTVKIFFVLTFVFLGVTVHGQNVSGVTMLPLPQKTVWLDGNFRFDSDFTFCIRDFENDRLKGAVQRFLDRLGRHCNLMIASRKSLNPKDKPNATLNIYCVRSGKPEPGENESYQLKIQDKTIVIEAETDLGVLHALETLYQMVATSANYQQIPNCIISDAPRFTWRGLMIDVCRHFIPIEVIKNNIDAMALVKMNVLHLHLSENQGFRIESKRFPLLHQLGSDGNYYTQDQMKDLIQYAANRGIRIVPEFDIPGHSTAWLVGYPEFASAPGPYEIEKYYGVMDPVFNPVNPKTYKFFDAFFKEMCALFPDAYMHIGGDENNGVHWDANPEIQAFMKKESLKNNHELQALFNNKIEKILAQYGKKMMGWDEIMCDELPESCVIQSWRGRQSMVEAAQKGFTSLLSNGYYIDLCQPIAYHYLNDPLPDTLMLSAEQKKMILGGEATMWTELVTSNNIDSRIWPRTAAIAERYWSDKNVNNLLDLYLRLAKISIVLETADLTFLTCQEQMLRSFTGKKNNTALLTFLETITPVQGYQRHNYRKYSCYTPLNRIVDICTPDPIESALWREKVVLITSNKEFLKDVKLQLEQWKQALPAAISDLEQTPAFSEATSLAKNIFGMCEIGLEAISQIEKKEKAGTEWQKRKLEEINKFAVVVAEAQPSITEGIIQLVNLAAL